MTATLASLRSAPAASASGRGGRSSSLVVPTARTPTRRAVSRIAAHAHEARTPPRPSPDTPSRAPSWRTAAAALAATLAVTAGTALPPPAHADLPTATLDEATAAARPLPQQPVRTGRVWALIGLGAAGVFGAAVAVENNAAWFPAIAKANRAMAATKARAAAEEVTARSDATGGMTAAVAAGIADASRRAREAAAAAAAGEERGE